MRTGLNICPLHIGLAMAFAHLLAAPGGSSTESPSITPEQIVGAVKAGLRLDKGVEAPRVDVSVANGIITLTGTVDNPLSRKRACSRARRVKGVRGVVNRIRVVPQPLPNADLANAVIIALREDPAVDQYQVAVVAEDGTVTLQGTVDSWAEKELAGTIASSIKGVRAAENRIYVHPPFVRQDDELRTEIQQRLRWDSRVDAGLITVDIVDGQVTLNGTVGSVAEKHRAVTERYTTHM